MHSASSHGAMPSMRPSPTTRVPMDTSLRWLETASRFSTHGDLLPGSELAQRMHERWVNSGFLPIDEDPIRCLARWIVSGLVLSMESPWGRLVPTFQFDPATGLRYPCMDRLLGVLRPSLDEYDTALWFVTPNHWINDTCPVITMHTNLPQALMAARLDRHLVCGEG